MNESECHHLPDDISYEEWIRYVFGNSVSDACIEVWNDEANTARVLSFLTQLFQNPKELVGRFTPTQIDQGLYHIVNASCSSHMFAVRDTKLPWADRRACIDAMIPLYANLMAPLYRDLLGHTQCGLSADFPGGTCYMWWDIIPLYGGLDHPDSGRINEAVLHVFEEVLKLRAESCLESVLHGLGHWCLYMPERTEPIVRRFLTRTDISPELRDYAERAAVGNVQ